jgi:hypothetical protein
VKAISTSIASAGARPSSIENTSLIGRTALPSPFVSGRCSPGRTIMSAAGPSAGVAAAPVISLPKAALDPVHWEVTHAGGSQPVQDLL